MRALIIEDERRLAENIASSLREVCGFAVDTAFDGEQGLFLATGNPYDVVVLDLMLPALSGPEMLHAFRARGFKTPVLILTAREEKSSIVKLLNAGADDYLAKPFDLGELIARLKALIRRSHGQAVSKLSLGDLEMDTVQVSVKRSGVEIFLAPMEYRVLEYLLHRAGAVVSKTELSEHLYDYNWEKFSNVIEVYIAGLRRKVDGAKGQKLIHTVRGHGYVLRLGVDT
ncbi:MAG: response regulator transcription factor [Bryobacteraceae bacterium]